MTGVLSHHIRVLGSCIYPRGPGRSSTLATKLFLVLPRINPVFSSFSPLMHFLGTTCPTPISVEHADIRVKNYSVNSRERYVCNSGFKRKAGTSTLTECVINKNTNTAHWTTPNLKCIRKYLTPLCSPASCQG